MIGWNNQCFRPYYRWQALSALIPCWPAIALRAKLSLLDSSAAPSCFDFNTRVEKSGPTDHKDHLFAAAPSCRPKSKCYKSQTEALTHLLQQGFQVLALAKDRFMSLMFKLTFVTRYKRWLLLQKLGKLCWADCELHGTPEGSILGLTAQRHPPSQAQGTTIHGKLARTDQFSYSPKQKAEISVAGEPQQRNFPGSKAIKILMRDSNLHSFLCILSNRISFDIITVCIPSGQIHFRLKGKVSRDQLDQKAPCPEANSDAAASNKNLCRQRPLTGDSAYERANARWKAHIRWTML